MKFGKQIALVSLVLASVTPVFAQSRSGGLSSSLQLLSIPEVRKELKLTDTQSSQLQAIQSSLKTDMLKMLRGLKDVAPQERSKKFAAFRSDLDRKVVLILDAGQRKRLHELELQREGIRALLKPDVGAELRLTPKQRETFAKAARQESESIRNLYKEFPKDSDATKVQLARQQITAMQARTDSELYDTLTAEQKKQFTAMQGAPFKFPERKSSPVTISNSSASKPGVKK